MRDITLTEQEARILLFAINVRLDALKGFGLDEEKVLRSIKEKLQ